MRFSQRSAKNFRVVFVVLITGCALPSVDRAPTAEHEALLARAAKASTLKERFFLGAEARIRAGLGFGYVAAIREGGRSVALAAGNRTLEPVSPIRERDLLEIGSVSKTFTGILLHLAEIEGKLSIDAKLESILTELKGSEVGAVTLRDLGRHRSGLPPESSIKILDQDNPRHALNRGEQIAALSKEKLSKIPEGKTERDYEYSNWGYMTLGMVLERIDQREYKKLVERKVLFPLRMRSSGVDRKNRRHRKWIPKVSPGFALSADPLPLRDYDSFAAATGGIESNAVDMGKFLEALENPPNGKLGRAIEAAMESGMGWDSKLGESLFWKNGATGAHRSILLFDRTTKRGIFIGVNTLVNPDALGFFAMGAHPSDALLDRVLSPRIPSPEEWARLKGSYKAESDLRTIEIFETFGHRVARYGFIDGKVGGLIIPDEKENIWRLMDGLKDLDMIRVFDSGLRVTTFLYDGKPKITELKKVSTELEKYPAFER